jgi:hypothetical protein
MDSNGQRREAPEEWNATHPAKLAIAAGSICWQVVRTGHTDPETIKERALACIREETEGRNEDDEGLDEFMEDVENVIDIIFRGARQLMKNAGDDPFEAPNLMPFAFALGAACTSAQAAPMQHELNETKMKLKVAEGVMAIMGDRR